MALDDAILLLEGSVLASTHRADVSYTLEERLGEGAYGVVFRATERRRTATTDVVIKLLRPGAVRGLGAAAATIIEKEVLALQGLSRQVPPTPYVVRFLDTGVLRHSERASELPWIAIEYVNGGAQGVSLRARVEHSKRTIGHAFDRRRAELGARSMIAGVEAIHDFGVLHRDIGPNNVLCSGFGDDELFKIADFGIARIGSAATFGSVLLGTPGYCAPEQSFPDRVGVGTYSDVFGLACTLFFTLTGEEYLNADNIAETLVATFSSDRPRLLRATALCAELKADSAACVELDRVLASATHADPQRRVQSAREFGATVLPLLAAPNRAPDIPRHVPSIATALEWHFSVQAPERDFGKLESVGIDSDGQFLAVTNLGALVYWDSWEYRLVPLLHSTHWLACERVALRRWLLAANGGILADFEEGRVTRVIRADSEVDFLAVAGSFDGWLFGVGRRQADAFELWLAHEGRFVEQRTLAGYAGVAGCVSLDQRSWLIGGHTHDGHGIVTRFSTPPDGLDDEHRFESAPIVACSSRPALERALFTTNTGGVVRYQTGTEPKLETENTGVATACAIDCFGREWTARNGELWTTLSDAPTRIWSALDAASEVAALMATPELLLAVGADGVVVRAVQRASRS